MAIAVLWQQWYETESKHWGILSDVLKRKQKYCVLFSTVSLIYCVALGMSCFLPSQCLILSIWETKIIIFVGREKGKHAINFFGWELFAQFKDDFEI